MRTILLMCVAASTATAADPSASVVKLHYDNGRLCSGVSVEGGYVLTVEHCGCENATAVFRDGTRLKVTPAHDPEKNLRDQVTALRLSGKAPATATISSKKVTKGEVVRSYGYPAGKWSMNEGVVTKTNGQFTSTDFFILEGNSGGGLFNEKGELVGIASSRNDLDGKPGSHYVSLDEIRLTMDAVGREPTADYTKANEVVVFTTPGCAPCDRLKMDIKAGHFKSFNLKSVEYRAGVWSDEKIVNELYTTIPDGANLGFPLIWVRGTENYRVGYSPDRRGGLIGFLGVVLDGIGKVIVGEKSPPAFPIRPYRRSRPDEKSEDMPPKPGDVPPPPAETDPESDLEAKLDELRSDLDKIKSANPLDKIRGVVALKEDIGELKTAIANNKPDLSEVDELRDKLSTVKGSLEKLQSGNPIAKIAALGSLKGEVADLKAIASNAKDDAQEDPWLFLLGLPGLITGLLHRRMAA